MTCAEVILVEYCDLAAFIDRGQEYFVIDRSHIFVMRTISVSGADPGFFKRGGHLRPTSKTKKGGPLWSQC